MDRKLYVTLLVVFVTCLFLYLVYAILSPFLNALGWAGVIWTITIPLHVRLLNLCKGREIPAAALMTTAVVLTLIIPIMILGISLTREAAAAYTYLESTAQSSRMLEFQDLLNHPLIAPWLDRIRPMIQPVSQEMDAMLLDAVKRGVSSLLNYSTGILKNFFRLFHQLVLMVVTLFFLYKDGRRMQEGFWKVVAISGTTPDHHRHGQARRECRDVRHLPYLPGAGYAGGARLLGRRLPSPFPLAH